ncbi:trigger factor [Guyparkeria hydrothermalis]|uniref:trigger factor n=1 Tax=Guyparkeria hydrothermalis TaxID=923 RepID=UPI00202142C4|nr:trigger factor [Guyparkeria hydrothermalis]MCL7744325.1 trigger factor [Guyparkeria hydrothermalis]
MQVELQPADGLTRRLAIEVPANEIDEQVEKRLKDMRGRVRIDGFRPGKAPLSVIRMQYAARVRDDVIGDIMGQSFQKAVEENDLRVAGQPSIESIENNKQGEDLKFTAAVEVYPEIELGDMSKLKVETLTSEVGDEDVDEMIDTLRKQHASWKTVRHMARKGEKVTINFVGKIDGEAFEGGSAEDVEVIIGEGQMLPEFEKGLKGIKPGKPVTIEVNFPEDYQAEHLAGKTAEFEIEATKVEEQVLPEVDDEFAKQFGADSADKLREDVRENMERELKQTSRRRNKDRTIEALTESLEFDVPASLVEEEAKSMRDQFVRNQMPQADASKLDPSLFNEQAEKRVRMGLVIMEVVKDADLKPDDKRVDDFINEVASAYDEPDQVVAHYKGDHQMMSNARTVVLEEQAVEHILGKAKVSEKKVPFKELMNPQG